MNKLHYKIFIHNYKWFIIKQCNDVSIITADYHTIHKKKYETKQQQKKNHQPNTRNSLFGLGKCYAVISHRIKPLDDARLSKMFALMIANYNSVPPHIYARPLDVFDICLQMMSRKRTWVYEMSDNM